MITRKTISNVLAMATCAVIMLRAAHRTAAQSPDWSYPRPLNSNAATDSSTDYIPRVTTDGMGNWVATWSSFDDFGGSIGTDLDILWALSTDNGLTWTDRKVLNNNAPNDSANDGHATVRTDGGGNWVVTWEDEALDMDTDIWVARSTTAELTDPSDPGPWSNPEPLNNLGTDSSDDRGVACTTDGGGVWVAVWFSNQDLDGAGLDYDILWAYSTNNGETWTDPRLLNNNATTDSGYDRDPRVASDGAGNWVVVWQSDDDLGGTIGTDQDILVARSTTAELSNPSDPEPWSDPEPLNNNADTDSGDDDHPQVAADGAGLWLVTWSSNDDLDPPGPNIGIDRDILVATSTNKGVIWTDPQALNNNATTDSGSDYYGAHVATDGTGNWVAVWFSDEDLDPPGPNIGTDHDILVASSSDNGLTWTNPQPLNGNATTDSVEEDSTPWVTTDGTGHWVAVWYSNDDLDPPGPDIGTDYDILVARTDWGGADIPAVSDWGLAATTLLLLIAGTLVLIRRRVADVAPLAQHAAADRVVHVELGEQLAEGPGSHGAKPSAMGTPPRRPCPAPR